MTRTLDDDVQEESLPAIFGHCVDTYKAMRAAATPQEVEEARLMVWEGFLTKLIGDEMKLPVPYFSSVRNNLVRMGCIKQLQRGGGSSPSRWELLQAPTEELFREKAQKRSARDKSMEQLEGRLTDMNERVKTLEDGIKFLVEQFNKMGGPHE